MSDTTSVYQAYQGNTYLFGGNAPYVEEMYENYLANPGSVPDTWREYFDALQHVPAVDGSNAKDVPHLPVVNAFAERAKAGGTKVVDLTSVLTGFTAAPRATLNVTIAGPNGQIQGLYQIVNPDSGTISNHVMVRPGQN